MSSKNDKKLTTREKVGYGLGDTASNIFFFGVNGFIFFYYTEVCKIPAEAAGTLLLLPRLWDAISDPLMGAMADRTRTKWGTYRPYLLWLAIPFGLFGFLTFANPDFGETGKLVYAYVTYIMLMTVYTAINVPYSALMGVMSPQPEERTKLATYRFVGAFSGQLLISMAFLPLVYELGSGDKGVGFPRAMAVMAVVATVMFFLTFFWTKERVKPPLNKGNLAGDVKALLNNGPWLVMVAAALLTLTSAAVRWTIMPQYLKYYFGVGEEKYWWFLDGTSLVLTTGSIAFLTGVFLTPFFSKRFGKRNSLMVLTLLNGLTILLIYLVPRDGYSTLLILNIVGNLIAGPTPALVWSIYTDVADYGEWKSGRRVTGMAFSAAMFAQKLGISIGPWICGKVLGRVGFDPDEPITEPMIEAFRMIGCVLPGVLAIANGIVLIWYRLSDEEVKKIAAELQERRRDA
jgi:GPH family glycoside/pentoside/hexuronide:cation symporter